MKKFSLYKNGDSIYRLLDYDKNRFLLIDCKKRNMPFFVDSSTFKNYELVMDEKNNYFTPFDNLTNSEIQKANKIFATIANIVPFIGDISLRNEMIDKSSSIHKVSKQTIRHRLCEYLVAQSIFVFVKRKKPKEPDEDILIIRKALNKYYYNSSRLSLKSVYLRMLNEYYLDNKGELIKHPSLSKFKRYFYKSVKKTNFIISRYGKSKYLRDYSPRLSNGVSEYYQGIGYCEVDSTVADIWLINEEGEVVGRPIISAGICPVTGLCLGVYVGFEESAETLSQMFINIASDKIDFCKKNNIEIEQWQWPNKGLPRTIISDRGQTFVSNAIQNLSELGVTLISLEPFQPNYKGTIESFFHTLQNLYMDELKNCGVIRKDINERERSDYRLDACLTLDDFREIIVRCIIYFNSKRVIDIPFDYIGKTKPFSANYFSLKKEENKDAFIEIDSKTLRLFMLPRTKGYFKEDGVHLNGLRYRQYGYLNDYLERTTGTFAYNRFDMGEVYLIDKDKNFIPFELIDSTFSKKSYDDSVNIKAKKNDYISSYKEESLKARLALSKSILQDIKRRRKGADLAKHRQTKRVEINKLRIKENKNE